MDTGMRASIGVYHLRCFGCAGWCQRARLGCRLRDWQWNIPLFFLLLLLYPLAYRHSQLTRRHGRFVSQVSCCPKWCDPQLCMICPASFVAAQHRRLHRRERKNAGRRRTEISFVVYTCKIYPNIAFRWASSVGQQKGWNSPQ